MYLAFCIIYVDQQMHTILTIMIQTLLLIDRASVGLNNKRRNLYEFYPQPTKNHLLEGPKERVS